jgi:hypothetical protein
VHRCANDCMRHSGDISELRREVERLNRKVFNGREGG